MVSYKPSLISGEGRQIVSAGVTFPGVLYGMTAGDELLRIGGR